MKNIIGKRVKFKVLKKLRSTGRIKKYIETHIGTVKTVDGNTVIIEGLEDDGGAGLHSRPINEIVVMRGRK